MLKKFEVTNFKNFEKKISFDFTNSKNYTFSQECVVDGLINKALVYGHNGIGKSNLGFAIFDLVLHMTDKRFPTDNYQNYLNACSQDEFALFRYEFQLAEGELIYEYSKADVETLIYESITINGDEYAHIDRSNSHNARINALGAESLESDLGESKVSVVAYISKNAVLKNDRNNRCFKAFITFVEGMLFFRSLEKHNYIGLKQGQSNIIADIIEKGNVSDFQSFLNEAGIDCQLSIMDDGIEKTLGFNFGCKEIPLIDIASQGTKALLLFYYWFQYLQDATASKATFVFIDEFDAFYHHALSGLIVKKLKRIQAQVVITTHNTSIITNELLRPDCYFLMNQQGLISLANRTSKELREANNIEKMYRAGSFDG